MNIAPTTIAYLFGAGTVLLLVVAAFCIAKAHIDGQRDHRRKVAEAFERHRERGDL